MSHDTMRSCVKRLPFTSRPTNYLTPQKSPACSVPLKTKHECHEKTKVSCSDPGGLSCNESIMAKMVSNDINDANVNRGTPCPLCDSPADHDKKSPHGTNSGLISSQICFLEGEATIECKRRVAALTASSRAEPRAAPSAAPSAVPNAAL